MDCRIDSSYGYVAISLAVHTAAALALMRCGLPPLMAGLGGALLLVTALLDVRERGWRVSARAVTRLRVEATGWWLWRRDGRCCGPAQPVAARMWPALVLLVLRDERGRRESIVVCADAVEPGDLRRLRAHLVRDLASIVR